MFKFHEFHYELPRCGLFCVDPPWNSLSFLDLWVDILNQIWKIFAIIVWISLSFFYSNSCFFSFFSSNCIYAQTIWYFPMDHQGSIYSDLYFLCVSVLIVFYTSNSLMFFSFSMSILLLSWFSCYSFISCKFPFQNFHLLLFFYSFKFFPQTPHLFTYYILFSFKFLKIF